ncbi:DNA cytosine methyltransferase [Aeromonas veronii]|uniref:DNA cytosine methyltransferase n=2 Tax=Aeromonas TaxID=642 RepID=UPI0002807CEC|nr:DNA cytosine methyltransferase [Aeromonas veronii]EKB15859.1 DNA (cytosine-5-)-methyltransferase [Aeromonas veronii AER397]MBS4690884.1 DNA cytosine methyltransferase [Aeromonas veronii bv. veronii]OKP38863.1 DNA (cytosine-5-)-methyltransferase [Aeromonas veronii bv. veronii]
MSIFSSSIPVVDLFAGPGGLGEGFSSLNDGKAFEIRVSAEKDPIARETLRLRSFYRLLKNHRRDCLQDYYQYCNGDADQPYTEKTNDLWEKAGLEAMCLEIGSESGNQRLDQAITKALENRNESQPWVLIGGPPCQAYSLAGRSRNKGKSDYKPEEDHRHFLYKEYLRIIQRNRPDIFVMENVKGILSSKINGDFIFHQILRDLANPNAALDVSDDDLRYQIVSLVSDEVFRDGDDPKAIDARKFIIKSEEYGIPQARHRVILLGIRDDRILTELPKLSQEEPITVKQVIGDLPVLRSKLSKQEDSYENWVSSVNDQLMELALNAPLGAEHIKPLANKLSAVAETLEASHPGSLRLEKDEKSVFIGNYKLEKWYSDPKLKVWLNHETRGHRIDDLARYGFAACFAEEYGRSPKGHTDFCLPGLAPDHKNWESGNFSDRFRVQLADAPSTTITSHISKDGHYFIHYDPRQCRSLTVREAARLQTFPDNYFFQGGRTQQYHQVGNAVPPLLANKIAKLVLNIILSKHNHHK